MFYLEECSLEESSNVKDKGSYDILILNIIFYCMYYFSRPWELRLSGCYKPFDQIESRTFVPMLPQITSFLLHYVSGIAQISHVQSTSCIHQCSEWVHCLSIFNNCKLLIRAMLWAVRSSPSIMTNVKALVSTLLAQF